MATLKFIRTEQTDKAIKFIVQEEGYCLTQFKKLYQKYYWVPKSLVSEINETTANIADWFYEKNIKINHYADFMKGLSNS